MVFLSLIYHVATLNLQFRYNSAIGIGIPYNVQQPFYSQSVRFLKIAPDATYAREDSEPWQGQYYDLLRSAQFDSLCLPFQDHWKNDIGITIIFLEHTQVRLDHTRICLNPSQPPKIMGHSSGRYSHGLLESRYWEVYHMQRP